MNACLPLSIIAVAISTYSLLKKEKREDNGEELLEGLREELKEELERVQLESLRTIQNVKTEATKFYGKANALMERAKVLLDGLERKTREAEEKIDGKVAGVEVKLENLRRDVRELELTMASIREEVGRVHLALLDFDKRIKDVGKNVTEAEKIALNVLTRIEEVLENEAEHPAEGDRENP